MTPRAIVPTLYRTSLDSSIQPMAAGHVFRVASFLAPHVDTQLIAIFFFFYEILFRRVWLASWGRRCCSLVPSIYTVQIDGRGLVHVLIGESWPSDLLAFAFVVLFTRNRIVTILAWGVHGEDRSCPSQGHFIGPTIKGWIQPTHLIEGQTHLICNLYALYHIELNVFEVG